MPVTFVKGDLLAEITRAEAGNGPRAIAFPAECEGTMDAGVAVAVKRRWPGMAEAFKAHGEGRKMQIGDVFAWRDPNDAGVFVYALGIHRGVAKPKISTLERALRAMIEQASRDKV